MCLLSALCSIPAQHHLHLPYPHPHLHCWPKELPIRSKEHVINEHFDTYVLTFAQLPGGLQLCPMYRPEEDHYQGSTATAVVNKNLNNSVIMFDFPLGSLHRSSVSPRADMFTYLLFYDIP